MQNMFFVSFASAFPVFSILFSFKNNVSVFRRRKPGRIGQRRVNIGVCKQRKKRTGHIRCVFFITFYLVQQRFICIFR